MLEQQKKNNLLIIKDKMIGLPRSKLEKIQILKQKKEFLIESIQMAKSSI